MFHAEEALRSAQNAELDGSGVQRTWPVVDALVKIDVCVQGIRTS